MEHCNHNHAAEDHAAIEWQGSGITAISHLPNALVIDLRAVVHRSHGQPGTDLGTVGVQPAAVILDGGQWPGRLPALPVTINDGSVWSSQDYDRTIRCPFKSNGEAVLNLYMASGEELLQLEADQLTITFTGDPEFLEDFVPEWAEDDPEPM